MAAGRPFSRFSVPPSRPATGVGQDRPRAERCPIRPRKNGRSSGATRFSYRVRIQVPPVVRSRKLEFSTPSAMPDSEVSSPMSYPARKAAASSPSTRV